MANRQGRNYTIFIDNADAERALDRLRTRAAELTRRIAEIQRTGGDAAREIQRLGNTQQQIRALETSISQGVTRSLRDLQNEVRRLEGLLARATDPETIRELNSQLVTARQNLLEYRANVLEVESAQAQLNRQNRSMGQFIATFAANIATDLFRQGLQAVKDFTGEISSALKEYQKFLAVLKVGLGSDFAAKAAIGQLSKFSADTPMELNEVTASYIKLVNRGFKPTNEELTKLGDLAYSQGKSLDQLVEALLDAQTGENERLKEFGIKASKAADEVTFSFKGQTVTVKQNEKAIRDVILGYGEMEGVAGTMIGVSKTLEGIESNTADTIKRLATNIGRILAPAWLSAASALNSFLSDLADFTTPRGLDEISIDMLSLDNTIKSLEKDTRPLIDRYDELTAKADKLGGTSKLSKIEQDELQKIINGITQTIPGAVTQFDQYGNAISISTDRVREHIQAEKERLKLLNKDRIEATNRQISANERELKSMEDLIRQIEKTGTYYTTQYYSAGGGGVPAATTIKATDAEVKELTARYKELSGQQMGLRQQLKLDTGEFLELKKKEAEGGLKKDLDVVSSASKGNEKIKQGREQLAKALLEIGDKILGHSLNSYEREVLESKRRYDELRLQAKKFGVDTTQLDNLQAQENLLIWRKYWAERAADFARGSNSVKNPSKELRDQAVAATGARVIKDADALFAGIQRLDKENLYAKQYALAKAEGAKRLQAQLELLEAERKQELRSVDLTQAERLNIEERYRVRRKEAETKHYTELTDSAIQFLSHALNAFQAFSSAQAMREQNELARDRALNEKKKEQYKKQLDSKLITRDQYDKKVASLDSAMEAKERAMKKKQFEREKLANITKATMGVAQAVVQMLTAGPFIGQALAASAAIMGAIQIAIIASQKAPEFGRGGRIKGPRHSDKSHGLPVTNPETGNIEAYLEGDEGIIKRSAMQDRRVYSIRGTISQITSRLNGLHGGATWESGARLVPAWLNYSPGHLNYTGISGAMGNIKAYETGGIFKSGPVTAAAAADTAAVDPEVKAILISNTNAFNLLSAQLARGIRADVLLTEVERQQKRADNVRSAATFKP